MGPHDQTRDDRRELKILAFFIHRYRWGEQIRGDERGFLEKMRHYKRLGTTVYVAELEPSLQESLNESIYTSLKIWLKLKAGMNPLEQIAALLRLIVAALRLSSKADYDVIYAHNNDIENVIPAYVLKLVSRKPLIVVFHLLRHQEMVCFKDAVSTRLKKGFSIPSALMASLLDVARGFAYRRADLYISVSEAMKKEIVKQLAVHKVVVAGNGVNTGKFKPYDLSKVYDAAFLGRLHPQKGIETLLRAWKAVTTEDHTARLVLIGGGDVNNVEHYRNLIHDLRINENVELKGFVPDEELVRLLNCSKIFVFPSKYDGFPLAVAEAMACGLPCIISDIPALRENYGKVAILVKPNDPKRLAKAVIELLSDEERRRQLGKKARESVSEFDWKDVVERELEAIIDLWKGLERSC